MQKHSHITEWTVIIFTGSVLSLKGHTCDVHAYECSNRIYTWNHIISHDVMLNNGGWYFINGNVLNTVSSKETYYQSNCVVSTLSNDDRYWRSGHFRQPCINLTHSLTHSLTLSLSPSLNSTQLNSMNKWINQSINRIIHTFTHVLIFTH